MMKKKRVKRRALKPGAPSFAAMPATYAGLMDLFVPRSIHDAAAYIAAVKMLDALVGHKLNHDQEAYLDKVARLVEEYEDENIPEPATGIAILKFLLDEHDLDAGDLGGLLGVSRSAATRILTAAPALSAPHAEKLAARFAVSADLFLA